MRTIVLEISSPEDGDDCSEMRDSVKNKVSGAFQSRGGGFEVSKQQPSLYSLNESSTGSFYVASSDEEVPVSEKGPPNERLQMEAKKQR